MCGELVENWMTERSDVYEKKLERGEEKEEDEEEGEEALNSLGVERFSFLNVFSRYDHVRILLLLLNENMNVRTRMPEIKLDLAPQG